MTINCLPVLAPLGATPPPTPVANGQSANGQSARRQSVTARTTTGRTELAQRTSAEDMATRPTTGQHVTGPPVTGTSVTGTSVTRPAVTALAVTGQVTGPSETGHGAATLSVHPCCGFCRARLNRCAARQIARQLLGDEHPATETAMLLVSELVTNSVMHSQSGEPGGTVTVALCPGPAGILVQVCDDGGSSEPCLSAIAGNGASMATACCSSTCSPIAGERSPSPEGRITWCRVSSRPPPPHASAPH